jgi:hypothetical protein
MNLANALLNKLKAEQAAFALEALKRPQNRDAFEYGHRVGLVAGYEASINILFALLEDDKHNDNNL